MFHYLPGESIHFNVQPSAFQMVPESLTQPSRTLVITCNPVGTNPSTQYPHNNVLTSS